MADPELLRYLSARTGLGVKYLDLQGREDLGCTRTITGPVPPGGPEGWDRAQPDPKTALWEEAAGQARVVPECSGHPDQRRCQRRSEPFTKGSR
jgi:hypothetical protein